MLPGVHDSRFHRTLRGERDGAMPLWLMRQAGRYLPEYREIRARSRHFLDFCYRPELATEATLQPIRRFGFDAAIIFSDILVVADALGRNVRFLEGEGPAMDPLGVEEIAGLHEHWRIEHLAPVYEAIAQTRAALPSTVALLGFAGAPWTLATYMIAGEGTKDQAPARLFAYRHQEAFQRLIDLLVETTTAHLIRQIDAGADTVQIFDSWAGVLPVPAFRRWCHAPMVAVAEGVRAARPDARIIGFARGAGTVALRALAAERVFDALSLDTTAELESLRDVSTVWQGNLDPLVLVAGGAALEEAIDGLMAATDGRPHIANLGHGILPQTPIAHVERLVARIRGTV